MARKSKLTSAEVAAYNERCTALLSAALAYASKGFYVIPLHEPLFNDAGECTGCTCEGWKRSEQHHQWLISKGLGNKFDPNYTCPERSRGKHARIGNDWETKASIDPEQIKAWWDQWPTANIGIAPGKSGLIVLDGDTYKENYQGNDVLTLAERQTPTALSGNGGEHWYYAMPEGKQYGNHTGDLPKWMDIRGCGSLIVAPPSLHYGGKVYTWEDGYSLVDLDPLPLPAKLIAVLDAAKTAPGAKVVFTTGSATLPDLSQLPLWTQTELDTVPLNGKRSEVDYGVTAEMVRKGFTDDQIKAVFEAKPLGTGGKYAQEGERYLAQTISKARGEVAMQAKPKKFYHQTEGGLAERLADEHGAEIRCIFLRDRKQLWQVWNGKQWQVDRGEQMMRKAKATVRGMYAEVGEIQDDKERKEYAKWVRACDNKQKLQAMINLAGDIPGITATMNDFDADPFLLNCENGVLDLRTGELMPHDPKYMCSRLAVAYRSDCPTPLWDSFLKKFFTGNEEVAEFLRRFGGYTLVGKATEKHFVIMNGPSGNNGKSTYLGALRSVLGGYAYSIKLDVLTALSHSSGGDAATPSLLGMQNSRLVTSDEIPDGWRPNVSLLKTMTSGCLDPINVRGLYDSNSSFDASMALWLFGNFKPRLPSEDEGLWNRALLVPFTYQIPKDQVDQNFAEKLQAELPGILAYFVKGTMQWLASGLQIPQAVTKATQEYRDEMDIVQRFISECCYVGPDFKASPKALWDAWEVWHKGKGGGSYTRHSFGLKLKNLGYELKESSGLSWRLGLGLSRLVAEETEG